VDSHVINVKIKSLLFCVTDTMQSQKSLLEYGAEVEATMSDSDDDDDDSSRTPLGVRRAESLEGPYSLLSLPLPTDAPVRRDSPGWASNTSLSPALSNTEKRTSQSLDQRLDELFAKGRCIGDGMSPRSSASDMESDSLSEEELDIIKLRKPITVTLQPSASKTTPLVTSQPKPSQDTRSESASAEADRVVSTGKNAASLSDDMVDEIVRMKPMQARAARQPSESGGGSRFPEDLSAKSHGNNVPVDLSAKRGGSEQLLPVSTDVIPSSVSTSSAAVSPNIPATSALPFAKSLPSHTQSSEQPHCQRQSTADAVTQLTCDVRTASGAAGTDNTTMLSSTTSSVPCSIACVQQQQPLCSPSSSVHCSATAHQLVTDVSTHQLRQPRSDGLLATTTSGY